MKRNGRKTAFRVHRWLGRALAVWVALVCLSGVVAVFRAELDWTTTPSLRVAPHDGDAAMSSVRATVAAAFPRHEQRHAIAPETIRSAARVHLRSPSGQWLDVFVSPDGRDILGQRSMSGRCYSVADCVRQFHVRLLLGRVGRVVAGCLALAWLVLLIAGWALGRGPKRDAARTADTRGAWRDVRANHRRIGYYAMPFAIAMSLTGAYLGLEATGAFPRHWAEIGNAIESVHVGGFAPDGWPSLLLQLAWCGLGILPVTVAISGIRLMITRLGRERARGYAAPATRRPTRVRKLGSSVSEGSKT